PVNENDTATLTGSFTDPGTRDTHTVVINWGPGEGTTTLTLAAGLTTFGASHTYRDDGPGGTASDVYAVGVAVTDDDAGSSSVGTAVTVNNVAPTITGLSVTPDPVDENGTVTLTGSFADAGTWDTHTVVINWGDRK